MVTDRNPYKAARQPRVTARIGNILLLNVASLAVSQSVQPVFSILKADEIRRRANLSYAAIAEGMGLKARQTVGHWFRGRGEPTVALCTSAFTGLCVLLICLEAASLNAIAQRLNER